MASTDPARHAMDELRRGLGGDEETTDDQARRVNDVLRQLASEDGALAEVDLPDRVLATPAVSQSDLLVNAEGQPNVGSERRAELASADSVDLICAFVIWSGVRHLSEALSAVVERGGRVRVITTT